MIQILSSFSKPEYMCYLDSLLTFSNSLLDSEAFETLKMHLNVKQVQEFQIHFTPLLNTASLLKTMFELRSNI